MEAQGGLGMADIKLARLPDRTPVKLTISLPPDVHAALRDYLTAYQAIYDDNVASIADLVPAMLESFIQSDRGFARARRRLSGEPK